MFALAGRNFRSISLLRTSTLSLIDPACVAAKVLPPAANTPEETLLLPLDCSSSLSGCKTPFSVAATGRLWSRTLLVGSSKLAGLEFTGRPFILVVFEDRTVGIGGKLLKMPKIQAKYESTKAIMRQSLKHHGCKLFNLLPNEVRMFMGTVAQFKTKLDNILKNYPDHPHMEGLIPDAVDLDGVRSNSLVDWVRKLGVIEENYIITDGCEEL